MDERAMTETEVGREEGAAYVEQCRGALKPFAELHDIELRGWGGSFPKLDVYARAQQVTVRMLIRAKEAFDALSKNTYPDPAHEYMAEMHGDPRCKCNGPNCGECRARNGVGNAPGGRG